MEIKLLGIRRDTNIGYRLKFSINGIIVRSDGVFTLGHIMDTFNLTKDDLNKLISD